MIQTLFSPPHTLQVSYSGEWDCQSITLIAISKGDHGNSHIPLRTISSGGQANGFILDLRDYLKEGESYELHVQPQETVLQGERHLTMPYNTTVSWSTKKKRGGWNEIFLRILGSLPPKSLVLRSDSGTRFLPADNGSGDISRFYFNAGNEQFKIDWADGFPYSEEVLYIENRREL